MEKQAKEQNPFTEYFKAIHSENGALRVDELGTIHTTIYDEEMDGIECDFNYDGCVQINTDGYEYITLSPDTLRHLANLVEKAEKMYDKQYINL